MFRKKVQPLADVLRNIVREEGLETPLMQKRAVDAWEKVVGQMINRYTEEKFIKNQVMWVKISSPSLRQDLSMMRQRLTGKINEAVGSQVITDVKVY